MPVPAVPDPLWPDLVPVLEDVVGSAIELTCYVPKALEDVPRVKVVIELARQGLELARAHWPDEQ